MERHLGAFKDSSDRNGKLATAILAFPKTGSVRLTLQRIVLVAHAAAVRALRTMRPAHGFKVLAGFVGVLELGLIEGGSHV
jgi:hypothetical protein